MVCMRKTHKNISKSVERAIRSKSNIHILRVSKYKRNFNNELATFQSGCGEVAFYTCKVKVKGKKYHWKDSLK